MTNPKRNARTFSEWWHGDYAREHYLIGVLVGLLLGALIGLAARAFIPAWRPMDAVPGNTHQAALVRGASTQQGESMDPAALGF